VQFTLRNALVACLAAFVLAGFAMGAAQATTEPSTSLLVEVVISKATVILGQYASSATHDGLIPLGGAVPRGDFLHFEVVNHSPESADFVAFGKRTGTVRPRQIGHFNVLALERGVFHYEATFTGGRSTVRGIILVK